jgi:hypothetical protein
MMECFMSNEFLDFPEFKRTSRFFQRKVRTVSKIRVGLLAAAFAVSSVAIPGNVAGASSSIKCTEQYLVWVQSADLRYYPGGPANGFVGTYYDKFNVNDKQGAWYGGNLYTNGGSPKGNGYTLAQNLIYNGCF